MHACADARNSGEKMSRCVGGGGVWDMICELVQSVYMPSDLTQCVAVSRCCSVLQCVAVDMTMSLCTQCVAVCCSVLQCVAVCCAWDMIVSSCTWCRYRLVYLEYLE